MLRRRLQAIPPIIVMPINPDTMVVGSGTTWGLMTGHVCGTTCGCTTIGGGGTNGGGGTGGMVGSGSSG